MQNRNRQAAEGILFTDQYQLTMAHLYYRMGLHERQAQFDYFFRSYPDYGQHKAGYCINAGLEWLLDWMGQTRFRDGDIEYLRSQRSQTGERLFAEDFLAWLAANGNFDNLTLRAIPEGAEPSQLPNSDRHQGRPYPFRRTRAARSGIWLAPRS